MAWNCLGGLRRTSHPAFTSTPSRQAAREVTPGVAPKTRGVGRRALGRDIEALGTVGAKHFAQEPEPPGLKPGEARDRRAARALELGQKGALGNKSGHRRAVRDGVQRFERARVRRCAP